ncbi:DUF1027 domain-containing protein [Mycoplasmatota bacterium]|nr:DUF1027 domain-containing protein [Mycoplasmatota bacterium]
MKDIIRVKNRKFILVKEYRDCFELEDLESKYIEEIFDKYDYILGDFSAGILRIKGFHHNNKVDNYKHIPDYISESCVYGCPFYILKRVKGGRKNG